MDRVQLRLLMCRWTCRHGRLEVQSLAAVLFFSRTTQKSNEPRACLTSASHRQALARGRGAGRVCAPAGCCLALHTAHVACLALQACRSKGAAKEQRVAYARAGLASASIVYTSGAHTVRTMHTVYTRIRASSGLTARHVIYRCAASRPWRINVFSRRLPTYTCKAGVRNRTVRRATGD